MLASWIDLVLGGATANHAQDGKELWATKKLPGVVILVHGVNSDGEWYEATEAGLCAGLNTRLAREDEQVARPDQVGQLRPAAYRQELTPNGFIDDKLEAGTFVDDDADSPVIRFRWGYRVSKDDKALYGTSLWLNERDAWGGGPFANGCATLADCWSAGLSDEVLGWWVAQYFNTTPGREFFRMPPRAYYAHAAWRLAMLVELIRQKQPDVPVTIIAHSQGTMIAMASAFVGENALGGAGVADSYQLFNSPCNLTLRGVPRLTDAGLHADVGGRVTEAARRRTFARFLAIVKKRQAVRQSDTTFDKVCGNPRPVDGSDACTATGERAAGRDARGWVITHCNPADQLISVVSIQGIGWRGVTDAERQAVGAAGVLRQRVWADGVVAGAPWRVGTGGARRYHYWKNHWSRPSRPGFDPYWYPASPLLRYVWRAAAQDPGTTRGQAIGALVQAFVLAPVHLPLVQPVNATPPADHAVTDDGAAVPEPIVPASMRGGRFDEGRDRDYEAIGAADTVEDANDPYNKARKREVAALRRDMRRSEDADIGWKDKAGDADAEAQMRYEHHARVRMAARRRSTTLDDPQERERWSRMADRFDGRDAEASAFMAKHFDDERIRWLSAGRDNNATDHSTILVNPLHAEKVIAWDVALGYSKLAKEDWRMLRQVADWRWVGAAQAVTGSILEFADYFHTGKVDGVALQADRRWRADAVGEVQIDMEREMASDVLSGPRGTRDPSRRP